MNRTYIYSIYVYQEPEKRILAINQPDLHLNYNLFQLGLTNDINITRFTRCNANDENCWFKFGGNITYIYGVNLGEINFLLIEIWVLQHHNTSSEWITSWVFFILQKPGVYSSSSSLLHQSIQKLHKKISGRKGYFCRPFLYQPPGVAMKRPESQRFFMLKQCCFSSRI